MIKAKRRRLFDPDIHPYIRYEFPEPTVLDTPSGDLDPICRLCFNPCSYGSYHGYRYESIQGWFMSRHPEAPCDAPFPSDPKERIVTVPACDKCCQEKNVHDYQPHGSRSDRYFMIMGTPFTVEGVHRMNDN